MQNYKDIIWTKIQNKISSTQKENGQNIYILIHESFLNKGDESDFGIKIFEVWNQDSMTENDMDIQRQLDEDIQNIIKTTLLETQFFDNYKITQNEGYAMTLENNYGDWIKLQWTDSCFYFITLSSGQY